MKNSNVVIYAGAAVAVAACGFLLNKGTREFLFNSLSRKGKSEEAEKPTPRTFARELPGDLQVANTPGPAMTLSIVGDELVASWHASNGTSSIRTAAPSADELHRLYEATTSYPLSPGAVAEIDSFIRNKFSK